MYKLIMNSLYGKTIEKIHDKKNVVYSLTKEEIEKGIEIL